MSTDDSPRFVRLRVELVVEITDPDELTGAALDHIGDDEFMPEEERVHASTTVREDEAEALAHLIDPFDLVNDVPGIELAHASWTSEQIEDYDPSAAEWDMDDLDDLDDFGSPRPGAHESDEAGDPKRGGGSRV
ncbi:hypothetical protein [Streptomyces sp. URMC 123]|uniref:hypothetical protein n=1 Tax=Streptomyces sp. URMC 123 TaxID=3423403 RepID=UPI003F1BD489